MQADIARFDWDDHNREKCQKHGVTLDEIEALFGDGLAIRPDLAHSEVEERFQGIGQTRMGRHVFLVFTLRMIDGMQHLRPISARYMHDKEVRHYEQDNSPFRH